MSHSSGRDSRIGEFLDSYLHALQRGEAPSRHRLLAEHPELAAALDGLDFIHQAARERPAAVPDDAMLPERQVLGDFRLLREVGRGGMAVVYEAEQISLGRRVALKVLPFAAVLDPKQLQRFKNEALAAAHLRHPHIVPVHAVGVERGVHYYAMQLIDGQSLAAVIREMKHRSPSVVPKTPITSHSSHRDPRYVRSAAALGRQAAEALDHAHELGIVHRDVKPANLLVDGTGELWVTDFGLARSRRDADLTITGELLGTYRYMSPEQTLAKRATIDHRTDVYSLGATLYELLTLEPAFPGDDPHVLMQDIARKDPIPPRRLNPTLPVDLETVLLKAMSKDPGRRYATAQEMADDLDRYLEDVPVHARRPTIGERAAKWSRRHRGLVAASAVVLLVAVVTLAIGAIRLAHEQKLTRDALTDAEDNLELAKGSVDEYLVQVGIFGLDTRVPTPARRALLAKALDFYDRYVVEHDEPAAQVSRGYVLVNLDRPEAALAAFDAALESAPFEAKKRNLWISALCGRSRCLDALGRHGESVAEMERAVDLDPQSGLAQSNYGTSLDRLQEHDLALAAYERAIAIDDKDTVSHLCRCVTLRKLGRFEEALRANDRVLELDPTHAGALQERSVVLGRLGRDVEALAAIDRAIVLEPGNAVEHYDRGVVLGRMKRIEDALAAYDRSIEIADDDAQPHANRALLLAVLGRPAEALDAADRAIEIEPWLSQAHVARSDALRQLGRIDDAVRAVEQWIEAAPDDATALYNLGVLFESLGRLEPALDAYDRAIAIDPDQSPPHHNRAVVLVKLGRKPEALKAFDRAIALGPAEAKAFSNRAGVLYEFGRFPEALDDCERAIELAPRNAVFHFHKGGVLASLTRWQEALAAYDRAVELDPGLALAHCHRGDILRWLGRDEDAMAAIEQGIARGEFPVVLVSWLAWQLATSPRESLRDGERAVELARRLVDVEPANGNLWNTLGVALCRTDAWEKALAALDESMKRRDGGDSVDWYFVAMAHHALGHYDEAQSWFEKAEQWAAAHAPDDAELHRIHAEVAAFLDEG